VLASHSIITQPTFVPFEEKDQLVVPHKNMRQYYTITIKQTTKVVKIRILLQVEGEEQNRKIAIKIEGFYSTTFVESI